MKHIDFLLDICFLILGIACAVFIITRRKRFDLWAGLLTCTAWILKGMKRITYHLVLLRLDQMLSAGRESGLTAFNIRASLLMQGIDLLTLLLLLAVVVRFVMIGLFQRWYNKAKKELRR